MVRHNYIQMVGKDGIMFRFKQLQVVDELRNDTGSLYKFV